MKVIIFFYLYLFFIPEGHSRSLYGKMINSNLSARQYREENVQEGKKEIKNRAPASADVAIDEFKDKNSNKLYYFLADLEGCSLKIYHNKKLRNVNKEILHDRAFKGRVLSDRRLFAINLDDRLYITETFCVFSKENE